METKNRFRPTLAQYRKIEYDLWVANGHIELGTNRLSDLQRKHDILEAANKELKKQLERQEEVTAYAGDRMEFWEKTAKQYENNGDRAIRLNWYLLALIVALSICLIVR